ncbi:MAG: hypothetical protein GEU98_15050 [Pseudonocardiaceae bacterium]|nr:hypothetical protein [Pseudonocardiaceae bacterium]
MTGTHVETDELRSAAKSIADAMGTADDTNLEQVPKKGDTYGHDKVTTALTNFCTTWELAKKILQQRSASAGETLEGAAGTYDEREQQEKSKFQGDGGGGAPQPSPSPGPSPAPQGAP